MLDNLSTGVRGPVAAGGGLLPGRRLATSELVEPARRASMAWSAIMHFAGSIVVPESVANPLKYYRNNTEPRAQLVDAAFERGGALRVFLHGRGVRRCPSPAGRRGDADAADQSLRLVQADERMHAPGPGARARARHVLLRYFNVAGADPQGRTGQIHAKANAPDQVAAQAAIGQRAGMSVFGTDYPTPDGTCMRDYIHVNDLAERTSWRCAPAQDGGRADAQLRLRTRLLGARGDRRGREGGRPAATDRLRGASCGRPAGAGGRPRPPVRARRLAPAPQPRRHGRDGPRMERRQARPAG